MTKSLACPFFKIAERGDHERIQDQNKNSCLIRDGFAVPGGHSLVIPKRHIHSFFDLTEIERTARLTRLDSSKAHQDSESSPSANNIGNNDGLGVGQTVHQVQIHHLIPRYDAEGSDLRGYVRWVVLRRRIIGVGHESTSTYYFKSSHQLIRKYRTS